MKWKFSAVALLLFCTLITPSGAILADTVDSSASVFPAPLANVPGTPSLVADSVDQITITWSANSNPAGIEYYAENVTNSTNSGWISDVSWASSGLSCVITYLFRVKARNSDLVETSFSAVASGSTLNCPASTGSRGSVAILPNNNQSSVTPPPTDSLQRESLLEQIQQKINAIALAIQNLFNNSYNHTPIPAAPIKSVEPAPAPVSVQLPIQKPATPNPPMLSDNKPILEPGLVQSAQDDTKISSCKKGFWNKVICFFKAFIGGIKLF